MGMATTAIPFETNQILLTSLPITVEHLLDERIGLHVRDRLELEQYQRHTLDGMVYKLSSAVLAEKLVDKRIERTHVFEHKVRYPRSWWQHFKQDVLDKTWLTRWFVDWRPVRYETKYKREVARLQADFTQWAKYPAADLVLAPESVHKHIVVPHEDMSVYWSHDGR